MVDFTHRMYKVKRQKFNVRYPLTINHYPLMQPFKQFQILWHSFDPQTLKAKFSYSFDNEVNFTETIDFSCPGFKSMHLWASAPLNLSVIDNLLFHLSIALWISYYKLSPTANIKIQSWIMNDDQTSFWKQFYINGLGEFFFRNNLKPFSPEFRTQNSEFSLQPSAICNLPSAIYSLSSNKALIPLGWGKDSIVSVELIKKLWIPFDTCTFGKDNPLYEQVNAVIGSPRLFIARQMDPLLFKMNTEWYYNGHVPISGIIAFSLTVVSYLYGYKYLVMSNEKSANEGNTEIDGMIINHQRSKSLDFEKAFNQYVHTYISPDVEYFSLLRWMYEVRIAQEFSKYPQYFSTFSSCNHNFHILPANNLESRIQNWKLWCGNCPKCAFVYTILRPRITDEQTIQIFGHELYQDPTLEPLFKELLGISGIKPFECVGTNEEMIFAMRKVVEHPALSVSPIMKLFQSEVMSKMSASDFITLEKKLRKVYDEDDIPNEIKKSLLF